MNSSFLGCNAAGSLSPLPFLGCYPSAIVHISYICHLGARPALRAADLPALQQYSPGYALLHKHNATAKHNKQHTFGWFLQCRVSCPTHTTNRFLSVFARRQAATQPRTIVIAVQSWAAHRFKHCYIIPRLVDVGCVMLQPDITKCYCTQYSWCSVHGQL